MNGCDGCGRDRPIYRHGPEGLGWCFLCVKEDERRAAKACPCGEPARCADPVNCPSNAR